MGKKLVIKGADFSANAIIANWVTIDNDGTVYHTRYMTDGTTSESSTAYFLKYQIARGQQFKVTTDHSTAQIGVANIVGVGLLKNNQLAKSLQYSQQSPEAPAGTYEFIADVDCDTLYVQTAAGNAASTTVVVKVLSE